jgi:hypothetical protein
MPQTIRKGANKKQNERPSPAIKILSDRFSYFLLTALTLIFLAPFSGKAFNIDDPLFVWMAQQIAHRPLDPYGFRLIWYSTVMPASEVVKNPPLAAYYIAGIAETAGWSERILHLAFLVPALIVVLGTYRLANRFTQKPLLAGVATLVTPGLLLSSTGLMCDTMMLALWILAIIIWLEGLDRMHHLILTSSALLISLCALTKYFGMALIPLLLAYSLARKRRFGMWGLHLVLPFAILAGYQYWTHALYGRGLLADAATYVLDQSAHPGGSPLTKTVIGLGFVGGCALMGLTFIPLLWTRRQIALGLVGPGIAGIACANQWISVNYTGQNLNWVSTQLALFVCGGVSILSLSIRDWWGNKRSPESLLLFFWVVGTFAFAAFVNWTVNARSVLPLIPAAGILLARRVDSLSPRVSTRPILKLMIPLAIAGIVSVWAMWADLEFADSARLAAQRFQKEFGNEVSRVNFQGHWGFQYYMQSFGFHPFNSDDYDYERGNVLILPQNNTNVIGVPPEFIVSSKTEAFDLAAKASTSQTAVGAGFYCDCWGPLPYAFGPTPPELYAVVQTRGR